MHQSALTTNHESFVHKQLHYDKVIHDQAYNGASCVWLELLQCNVILTITRSIRVSSKERLCLRRWE